MFTRIRKIQVRREARPSNPSRPWRTPSQASWTTSSATASVDTYMRATRRIEGSRLSTSSMNAASSPARSRETRARSRYEPSEGARRSSTDASLPGPMDAGGDDGDGADQGTSGDADRAPGLVVAVHGADLHRAARA